MTLPYVNHHWTIDDTLTSDQMNEISTSLSEETARTYTTTVSDVVASSSSGWNVTEVNAEKIGKQVRLRISASSTADATATSVYGVVQSQICALKEEWWPANFETGLVGVWATNTQPLLGGSIFTTGEVKGQIWRYNSDDTTSAWFYKRNGGNIVFTANYTVA